MLAASASPPAFSASQAAPDIRVQVDASDRLRGVQRAHISMNVEPGPLVLAYPKWIPGEHRPNGPITQLTSLRISAGGVPLAWERDPLDPFLFKLNVPAGVRTIDLRLDYLSPASRFGPGFGKTPNVTPDLALVLFNHLILYPANMHADAIRVAATVQLPGNWSADGALPMKSAGEGLWALPETSLATLVDSPVLAGAFLRKTEIPNWAHRARLTIASQAKDDLHVGQEQIDALGKLVEETRQLIGGDVPTDYAWLIAMSDALRHDGLEHLNSADVRTPTGFFRHQRHRHLWTLLPHELFHVWNGKYRRPQGMVTANFQQPISSELLWMYEGLTRYYGDIVLPTRSGLVPKSQTLDYLAFVGAQVERARPGRAWRSLGDTAVTVPVFADAPSAGTAARRGADYYNEMMLVWLEADMLIREHSRGLRSLDDFCRLFFAHRQGEVGIKPYVRADVINALAKVQELDWDEFFRQRVNAIAPEPPLAGLAAAGWGLVYDDATNPFLANVENGSGRYNFSTSLGFWVSAGGQIEDVVPGSPADKAAVAAGTRILEIDGQPWTIERARGLIAAKRSPRDVFRLTVETAHLRRTAELVHDGGLQIPHLRRLPDRIDTLSAILSPRASGAPGEKTASGTHL